MKIIDSEPNLDNLIDLINYVPVDGLIINGLLGEKIIEIAKKAKEEDIKIIILMPHNGLQAPDHGLTLQTPDLGLFSQTPENGLQTPDLGPLFSILVGYGVTAFLTFDEINKIEQVMIDYPKDFNYEVLNTKEESPRRKIFGSNLGNVPKDYQKVIGIFSASTTGKTTLSVNLAEVYSKHGISTTLIDTDHIKKDLLHHYKIDFENAAGQYEKLIQAIRLNEDIDVSKYAIEINKHLKIYSDNKESKLNHIARTTDTLVKQLKSNIIIIDISQHLTAEDINQILMLCDEKLLVIDQMVPSIKHALDLLEQLNKTNREISIIINKHHKIKSFKDKHIIGIFSNNNPIKNTCHISDNYKLLLDSMAEIKRAYGTDDIFDEEIEQIADEIYTIKTKKKGLFRKWVM